MKLKLNSIEDYA